MLISYRSKGWTWHSPINSPRSLQRRTLQSVDEVSTTWSSATTCRLDENEERWDEGQRSWQERPQSSEQPSNQQFNSTHPSSLEPPPPLLPFEKVKINEEKEKSYCFGVMCTWRTPLPCWCEHAKSFQLSLYIKKTSTSITSNKHLFGIMFNFKTANLQKLTLRWPLIGGKFLNVMNVDVSHLISSVQPGGRLCFGQFCNLSLSPRL